MTPDAEFVVVGAGPAGASAALFLARAGRTVTLIDRARFPRDKVCGEGVMPAGLEVLESLGARAAVERAGRPYRGVRFTDASGRQAFGRFPGGTHGVVIRRETLDHLLVERARSTPGVRLLEASRAVSPIIEGGRVRAVRLDGGQALGAHGFIFADGAASGAAGALGAARRVPRRRRFGLRAHFRGVRGLGEFVEVFLRPEGEIYLAPQAGDTALVSLLLEGSEMRRLAAGGAAQGFLDCLRRAPLAWRYLDAAERITPVLGAGPLGGRARRPAGANWRLAGDAAGSVDPITGEGVSLALLGGRLAAEHLMCGGSPEDYEQRWKALTRSKRALSAALLTLAGRPRLSSAAIALFARLPGAFDFILSIC